MLDALLNILIWAIIGALPGFYVFYLRDHNPFLGMGVGAVVAILLSELGIRFGLLTPEAAIALILVAFPLVMYLLLPRGGYSETITNAKRIRNLAYALSIPTVLIVFGVVIFPVIWNGALSVRSIEVRDLSDLQVFDFSELTLENFYEQVGFRIDAVPCETDDSGECAVNSRGEIEYMRVRDLVDRDSYSGFRETNEFDIGDTHYVISVQDRDFYPMIWRTLFYTVASTILAILFGLIAALIVREAFFGRSVFRGFVLFPYIAPVISVAFIWQVLFRQGGLVNEVMGTNIDFLTTRDDVLGVPIPLWMVIFFQAWRYFPFAFLFLLARLQAIPEDIYEAAQVDGATPSQRLLHITLPQLRAVIGTLFLLRFIWTFNKFDDVYLLTGVTSQTKVIPVRIFEALFTEQNVGAASAIAVIMAGILAVILIIYFKFFLVEDV